MSQEVTMVPDIDTEQIERVLSYLARLRVRHDQESMSVLDGLRPAWLGMSSWDVILEDLEAQRYREQRTRVVRLRLVEG